MILKHTQYELGIPLNTPIIQIYLIFWICLTLLGLVIAYRNWTILKRDWAGYFDFLSVRWKLITFTISGIFVSLAGYWTDDESWDIISGFGMSFFAFLIAPLAVGILFRFFFGRETLRNVFLALVFSAFSFSWFYDGYLVVRDGVYTSRFIGNFMLSGIIYLCAGIFWNLELSPENKIGFGFARPDWPQPPTNKKIGKAFLLAIPFGLVALFFIVGFVGWSL